MSNAEALLPELQVAHRDARPCSRLAEGRFFLAVCLCFFCVFTLGAGFAIYAGVRLQVTDYHQ